MHLKAEEKTARAVDRAADRASARGTLIPGDPTCRDPETQPSLLHKNQASGFRERKAFLEGSQRAMA